MAARLRSWSRSSQAASENPPRSTNRALSLWLLPLLLGACAPRTSSPPQAAEPARESSPSPVQAEAEQPLVLPPRAKAVPPPPAICGRLETPASSGQEPVCHAEALATALRTEDPEARNAALHALETCEDWPRGLLRALRAELGPPECGDVLTGPVLSAASDGGLQPELAETLFALGLGARLRRLAATPPAPPEAHDKASLEAYFQADLFPWISEQSGAIFEIAQRGAQLRGYARGVVAVEAGMADMRFVEIARAVPIPEEMQKDAELRDAYYASLDEALEPRKQRGRDAALVGLGELGRVGILIDPRLQAARALLSRVYGGRRIDALDRLLLPELPDVVGTASDAPLFSPIVASRAPTFYAPWLLSEQEVTLPLLRAYLDRGLPTSARLDLGSRKLDDAQALLLARAHIDLGRTYFQASEFAQARKLLDGRADPEARFLAALATSLMAGPQNAAQMIARGPRFADALGNLEALDEIAAGSGSFAGRARYNAAYLRELVAPAEDAAYWLDLAVRYEGASPRLKATEQTEAKARAQAARATARAITNHRPSGH